MKGSWAQGSAGCFLVARPMEKGTPSLKHTTLTTTIGVISGSRSVRTPKRGLAGLDAQLPSCPVAQCPGVLFSGKVFFFFFFFQTQPTKKKCARFFRHGTFSWASEIGFQGSNWRRCPRSCRSWRTCCAEFLSPAAQSDRWLEIPWLGLVFRGGVSISPTQSEAFGRGSEGPEK